MARRVKVFTLDLLIQELDERLKRFHVEAEQLSLREKVRALVEISYKTRCLGVSVVASHGLSSSAAIERLKVYLQQNVGVVVKGEELEVVSGISEYARRIRQLRVEYGMKILTGASLSDQFDIRIKPDEYILIDAIPDTDASRRWHVANRIRKQRSLGSKGRLLAYFMENVGSVVTTEELHYVASGKKEFGRRVRELRTEEGYAIATIFTGRPDLKMGEYILLSKDRIAEPHDRHISVEVQRIVYERDNNTCQNPSCRWNAGMRESHGPRILELHHVEHHASGGTNTAENLIVLCNRCHDEVHAGRLSMEFLR